MKSTAMTLMMLMAATVVYSESEPSAASHTVTVCLNSGTVSMLTMMRAKALASRMFAEIGISIDWHQASRNCPAQGIVVSMSAGTPANLKPGAFAYALPYEGTHIEVFYDRIGEYVEEPLIEIVLAHVLVHEITHILQGIERHSAQGVMKAKWDAMDYFHMKQQPLSFTPEDVQLIHIGLTAREHAVTLAMNTNPSGATASR